MRQGTKGRAEGDGDGQGLQGLVAEGGGGAGLGVNVCVRARARSRARVRLCVDDGGACVRARARLRIERAGLELMQRLRSLLRTRSLRQVGERSECGQPERMKRGANADAEFEAGGRAKRM